jgi:hypothetical protein
MGCLGWSACAWAAAGGREHGVEGREPELGLMRCWGVDGRETEAGWSCKVCSELKSSRRYLSRRWTRD